MNTDEQRELAMRAFGHIEGAEILRHACWPEILKWAKKHRKEILVAWPDDAPSEWAYYWALYIGDREVMRDRITESEWAYAWALDIGDREVMRDRVTDPEWAYCWAFHIGDREIMRERVTDSESPCYWAFNIEEQKEVSE